MKKMCTVCGYTTENDIRECPNCGSYNLKIVREGKYGSSDRFQRFR